MPNPPFERNHTRIQCRKDRSSGNWAIVFPDPDHPCTLPQGGREFHGSDLGTCHTCTCWRMEFVTSLGGFNVASFNVQRISSSWNYAWYLVRRDRRVTRNSPQKSPKTLHRAA